MDAPRLPYDRSCRRKRSVLRPLLEIELAATIAVTAMEYAYGESRFWETILIADAILAIDDRNISAVLLRSSSFGRLMDRDFHTQFPDASRTYLPL